MEHKFEKEEYPLFLCCIETNSFVLFFLYLFTYKTKDIMDCLPDLDISWIEETERLQRLCSETPTKEYMSSISTCFVYLNRDQYIDSVSHDTFVFPDSSQNIISQDVLLSMGDRYKKKTPNSRFLLKYCLLFHVNIDPDEILSFSQCETKDFESHASKYLRMYHTIESIEIPPSLWVFHPYHTLYFIFQEEESIESKRSSLKSILKSGGGGSSESGSSESGSGDIRRHKLTKRVRINLPHKLSRTTRKHRV
tara:strand:- start:56 stop:808 length:753 start_codon:yes stop_codon:yes gene_type:complete